MTEIYKILFLFFSFFFAFTSTSYAIVDPLSVPNNKFGVHILFASELGKAKDLINTSGGDWGYVTIPIQAIDKDLAKWQKFMDDCRKLHLIPIIRIATENHYFNTSVWRKPTEEDILDFANFLNSLNWPTKNRYIIVFNEVNRGDEWEGIPSPSEYTQALSYAIEIFKSLSPDFFIISAGLDNAAANVPGKSMNQYDFMVAMNNEIPGIFGQIDGLGSHSYPNPAFSGSPLSTTKMSISSFKYEADLAFQLSGKNLPVFITETGWSNEKLSRNQIASHFRHAFENVWSDNDIVAVTPFLLSAGTAPFLQFSLIDGNGNYNEISKELKNMQKISGQPRVNPADETVSFLSQGRNIPSKSFPQNFQYKAFSAEKTQTIIAFLKWILKLSD